MDNKLTTHVYPGRFQPFHKGHLEVIKQALIEVPGIIFVGIVVHTLHDNIITNDSFELEARKNNSPARNPFSPSERIKMIRACLLDELHTEASRVIPILLPRPEANWAVVKSMFPEQRTWIIPQSNEEFDEMKVHFFDSKGDKVYRIYNQGAANIHGCLIRDAIINGDSGWEHMVPEVIYKNVAEILSGRPLCGK
jgi:nicotinamide-nucleotide adenylyltransferase